MTNRDAKPTGNTAGKSVAESWLNITIMKTPNAREMDSGNMQILKLEKNRLTLDAV